MAQCVSECHASSHFKLSFIFISIYFCFLLQLCLHTKIKGERGRGREKTWKSCKKKEIYVYKKIKNEAKLFYTRPDSKFLARRRLRLLHSTTRCGKIFYLFFIFTFYYSYISTIFLFTKRSVPSLLLLLLFLWLLPYFRECQVKCLIYVLFAAKCD